MLSTIQHRIVQAVLSMVILQIALVTGDLMKILAILFLLIFAWGLLLAFYLIDWANEPGPNLPAARRRQPKIK